MGARCYWCVATDRDPERDPLGTCSDCWVFACDVHAELDAANRGKWECFDGVARLLSAGAGFDDADDVSHEAITSQAEFRERFPRIAEETVGERQEWHERTDDLLEKARLIAPEDVGRTAPGEEQRLLLADAVGVLRHYLPAQARYAFMVDPRPEHRIRGRLGRLLLELSHG
jgi:hypothetical protein